MPQDVGPASQHAGRITGLPKRDRALAAAVVAFLAGAIILAAGPEGNEPLPAAVTQSAESAEPSLAAEASQRTPSRRVAYDGGSFACPFRSDSMMWDTWLANACEYRAEVGLTIEYACSPGGVLHDVTGDRSYTDDSSVCSAGVHAGVISADEGGKVSVVIGAGRAGYIGSTRNGVDSASRGPWPGSFEVVLPPGNR